jgi:DNA-binding XRE family transcriptional regulator
MTNYIYALSDNELNVVYVGMSQTKDLVRPYQHRMSHNEKLKEWYNSLDYEPIVQILEKDILDIRKAETKWIKHFEELGHSLFNKVVNGTHFVLSQESITLGSYLKERRRLTDLTQEQFADRLGISLTVVRKIEQGKTNFVFDGLLQYAKAFGIDITATEKPHIYNL